MRSWLKKSELSDFEKLSDIHDVAVFVESKVNIKGKCCLWKRLSVTSSDSRQKLGMQSCRICDSSVSCKLVLWEEFIDKLECKHVIASLMLQ